MRYLTLLTLSFFVLLPQSAFSLPNSVPSALNEDLVAGSPATIIAQGLTLGAATTLAMDVEGTTAGTEHDQIVVVTGSVNLGNATLSLMGRHAPADGEKFGLIKNNGGNSVNGVFANSFPIDLNGTELEVSYSGGTSGNDVVLFVACGSTPASGMATGPITLASQDDLDNFTNEGVKWAGVSDNLTINGAAENFTDFCNLSELTSVTGKLTIRNVDQTTVATIPFPSLTTVGGEIAVVNNPGLTNLDGLGAITSVRDLDILSNSVLIDIDGLAVGTRPLAVRNYKLRRNTTLITGGTLEIDFTNNFEFFGNDNIQNPGRVKITGANTNKLLQNQGNGDVTDLSWLSADAGIPTAGTVSILSNPMLTSLWGMPAGINIRTLSVESNSMLASLSGLAAVNSIGSITIRNNNNLSTCCALTCTLIGNTIDNGGTVTLSGNASDCNSIQAIAISCGANLATDHVRVQLTGEWLETARVILTDLNGKMIADQKQSTASAFDVELSHLPAGIYQLQVTDGNNHQTQRVIVR